MKNLPAWLRGGLIGVVTNIAFIAAAFLSRSFVVLTLSLHPAWPILITVSDCFMMSDPDNSISENMFSCSVAFNSDMFNFIIVVAVSLLIYFIVGAVIGWVVGKVKNHTPS